MKISVYSGQLALRGSCSKFCNNVNFLAHKYNFNKHQMSGNITAHNILSPYVNNTKAETELLIKAGAVRDFILYRNEMINQSHTCINDIDDIIKVLCCE